MLITSHLAVTVLTAKTLSLGGPELIAAFAGGVLLDADHLFVNTKWISDIKNFLLYGTMTHGEIKQHSWMQEPLFGLVAGVGIGIIFSWLWPGVRWWIFPLFQGLHIGMDALMRYEHTPFVPWSDRKYRGPIMSNTKTELALSLLALSTIYILR